MVTKVRRRKDQSGRGSTQQNSILEHLSPPAELPADGSTSTNNNDDNTGGGGRITRNNNGRNGGDRRQQQRAAPAPPPPIAQSGSTMLSHPRLSRIMKEAQYEAFVDPYRGILPFFSLSCNAEEEGGGVRNDDNNYDTPSPWMQCDPVLKGEWKFERGEDIDTKNASNNKKAQQKVSSKKQQEVEIVNIDDDSSSVVPIQQLNFNDDSKENDDKDTVRIVQCGCPTIDSWAVEEWVKYQQLLSKKNKKGGKKRKRGNKNNAVEVGEVTDLSGDDNIVPADDVENNVNLAEVTPILICGRRKVDGDGSCPCDFNPFCLASLGGILDQYRYNAAKIRYLISNGRLSELLDDDDSDGGSVTLQTQEGIDVGRLSDDDRHVTGAEFSNLVRRHWSEIPSLGLEDDSESKKSAGQSDVRRSIQVDSAQTKTHVSNFICSGEEKVERYLEMTTLYQSALILPSSSQQEPVVESDGKMRISVPPGLRNLGATCYLNSQLQCLAQNLGFVHGLFTWRQVGAGNRMSQVLTQMQSILARMKYGPQSVICTNEFATALKLENNEMQDPNEFARLLFDRMQESFRKSSDFQLENLLPSIFRGTSAYVTKCHECNGLSERKESFMDLSIPIVHIEAKSAGDDVDVQRCFDAYLQPELLVGDNQYFCSACAKKTDASRSFVLETTPPVLNLQLARYVFDMATFSKKKLATKVKLPRTLAVPTKQGDEGDLTNTTVNYILCAVQNHLGTSAHGGHYIADVLDWNTGVWYEFNDEEVSMLEEGPKSSFDPNSNSASATGKGAKVEGSADAYNLFYVEQNYLSRQSNKELESTVDRICNNANGNESGEGILAAVDVQRVERYECEKERQNNSERLNKRLAFRSEQLMKLLCSQPNHFADETSSVSDKVWLDAAILRRFFSCKDGLDNIFRSDVATSDSAMLEDCKLLCSHPDGLHPQAARKGKLISQELYSALEKIMMEELTRFPCRNDSTNASSLERGGTAFKNYAVENGTWICEPCGIQFQTEGRKKLETFQTLISIYEDLVAGQNDLDLDSDLSESEVFVMYRPWVTSLRKCIESNLNVMKGTKKGKKDAANYGGVDALNLDGILSNEAETASDKKTEPSDGEGLDCQVNTKITCHHGKCHAMYKRRSVRLIPQSVWSKVLKVFPDAISHEFEPKMEESLGNCAACFHEKRREELFPAKLTEWKNQIREPGMLRDLYTKGGHDGEAPGNTPPEIEMFLEVCSDSGDKTNKLTCYIIHCREIQRWRDAYDCIVKAKKARKTNDFVRNQINDLLFKSCSDDAEAREWNFRSLTCDKHKRSVGFPPPDIGAINGDAAKLKEWLSSVSAAKFDLLLEDEFRTFISSLSSLEGILHGNNSSGLDQVTPTVSISIKDGALEVDVQPSPCTDGCAVCLFDDEFSDNGIICKKKEEAVAATAQAEVVPIEEDQSGPICKAFVHQVERNMSIDVAASSIAVNVSSNEVQETSNQRRGLRKRKAKGAFPVHEVEMALDGNLAHFRLLLYQVSRQSARNQRLYLMSPQLHEPSVTELTHLRDTETMQDLIQKPAPSDDSTSEEDERVIHVIMSYDDLGSTTQNKRGSERRMTKEERDEEDAIIATLTDKACGGWKTADVIARGKKSGKRQERGFQGTFLQSSLSQNSETEQSTPVKKSDDSMIIDEAKSKIDSSGEQSSSEMIVDEFKKEDVDASLASSDPERNICQADSDEVMIIGSNHETLNVIDVDDEEPTTEADMEAVDIVQDNSKRRKCDSKCALHDTCTIMDALDIGVGWTVHAVPRKGSPTKGSPAVDKYYFSPTGQRFRSLVSAQRHLNENASATTPVKRTREASQAELMENGESDSSDMEEFETKACQMSTRKLKTLESIIKRELESRKVGDGETGQKSKYFT